MSHGPNLLVVRLGAMGDILQTLPAVATLKHSNPGSRVTWAVEPRWRYLLEDNPYVDEIFALDRHTWQGVRQAWTGLRARRFQTAIDFQGLIKSALVAAAAHPERICGFAVNQVREKPAAWLYSDAIHSAAAHVVDRYLDLAAAVGARSVLRTFPLPEGEPEGELACGPFVLASPRAGWGAKEWPLANYGVLGEMLQRRCGIPLVLNGPAAIQVPHTLTHVSGLSGLVDATRRALAVVGVDSGPTHLASALSKPGVALFGPTDPARNGPYGKTMTVIRDGGAIDSYQRLREPDASMRAISVEQVFEALRLNGLG